MNARLRKQTKTTPLKLNNYFPDLKTVDCTSTGPGKSGSEPGHDAVVIISDGIASDQWPQASFLHERSLQFTHFRVRRITSADSVPA
jgi:hypothetical protein